LGIARIESSTFLLNKKSLNPEILPRLFSKFTTKSHKGTGLGLYISKNIVEAYISEITSATSVPPDL
jgi:signal transduction histidine kinase